MISTWLTVPEKILLCAAELSREGSHFSAEDLVVRCWERFPDTFGLQGYGNKFPDSNRVLTNIMGEKGLRGKGWLRKVGEKKYQVTEAGKHAASQFSSRSQPETVSRGASLDREIKEILLRLTESRAFQKFRLNEELTFGDLSSFWNISPRSNAYQLNVAIKDIDTALRAAETAFEPDGINNLILPGKAMPLTRSDITLAKSLHTYLKDRFKDDLDVIRRRSDERLRR